MTLSPGRETEIRAELAKVDAGHASEPYAVRDLLAALDAARKEGDKLAKAGELMRQIASPLKPTGMKAVAVREWREALAGWREQQRERE